jgi:hypothetical protein
VEQLARRGGAVPVLVALAAAAVKVAGGLLALALVRPWGRALPRRWLLITSTGASALLVVYGGLNVAIASLVLSDVIHPSAETDRTALRWHAGVWDLWFLAWGILLALATAGYWRRTMAGTVPRHISTTASLADLEQQAERARRSARELPSHRPAPSDRAPPPWRPNHATADI